KRAPSPDVVSSRLRCGLLDVECREISWLPSKWSKVLGWIAPMPTFPFFRIIKAVLLVPPGEPLPTYKRGSVPRHSATEPFVTLLLDPSAVSKYPVLLAYWPTAIE